MDAGREDREIVATFQRVWSTAFAARDIEAIAALYREDALFFGSMADLFRDRDGVRAYFTTLRTDVVLDDFPPLEARRVTPDTIVAAGYWRFLFGGEPKPYRLAWTLARDEEGWRIACHHASPR